MTNEKNQAPPIMIYISIALAEDPGNRLIETVEGAISFIKSIAEEVEPIPFAPGLASTEGDKYIIQAIQMTEEEKNNLPEFQGF